MSRALWSVVLVSLFASAGVAVAADPVDAPLPPPRPVLVPAPPPAMPIFLRRNRYEVWQNLAVDNRGRFVPLVVESPVGPVYRWNGEPAPWVVVEPRSYAKVYVGQ